MTEPGPEPATPAEALAAVEEICRRHGISALDDFLETCREFAREETLNIAVLGRFKAGKSSFLNHLLGRPLLPVGVIPVTAVVTEIEWGPVERAEVFFADGRRGGAPVSRIGDYLSESQNPGNALGVARVRIELPAMDRYRGIRFVDTPGLDSVFDHNTAASLGWLPNAGLALVAVGVDPPLSRHDVELIRNLRRYTPNIALLLTKIDILEEGGQAQVREFVQAQLGNWDHCVPVFPYSIRPGFEHLREELQSGLLSQARVEAAETRAAILRHKVSSLADECAGYLRVALQAAEVAESEREQLGRKILGEKESLDDTRLALKLIARHAAAATRSMFEALLRDDELTVRRTLQAGLEGEFPGWARSLSTSLEGFEQWARSALAQEIAGLSLKHRDGFLEPCRRAGRQLSQALQDFRNRLSERTLEALGVPLGTAAIELHVDDPKSPDVRVGRIFDHNWELLSWLIPMALVRGAVRKHYHRRLESLVFTNLSRLASQWEGVANASLAALEKEALRRLDGLIETIGQLIAAAPQQRARIRSDCERLQTLRCRLRA